MSRDWDLCPSEGTEFSYPGFLENEGEIMGSLPLQPASLGGIPSSENLKIPPGVRAGLTS
jgi:hypothetical protein